MRKKTPLALLSETLLKCPNKVLGKQRECDSASVCQAGLQFRNPTVHLKNKKRKKILQAFPILRST